MAYKGIYTGWCVWFAPLCYSYMGRSYEKNKYSFLNYIQFYMKKSIYFTDKKMFLDPPPLEVRSYRLTPFRPSVRPFVRASGKFPENWLIKFF